MNHEKLIHSNKICTKQKHTQRQYGSQNANKIKIWKSKIVEKNKNSYVDARRTASKWIMPLKKVDRSKRNNKNIYNIVKDLHKRSEKYAGGEWSKY